MSDGFSPGQTDINPLQPTDLIEEEAQLEKIDLPVAEYYRLFLVN